MFYRTPLVELNVALTEVLPCITTLQVLDFPEARQIIEQWREEYNYERPHSSLDDLTPSEFAERMTATA